MSPLFGKGGSSDGERGDRSAEERERARAEREERRAAREGSVAPPATRSARPTEAAVPFAAAAPLPASEPPAAEAPVTSEPEPDVVEPELEAAVVEPELAAEAEHELDPELDPDPQPDSTRPPTAEPAPEPAPPAEPTPQAEPATEPAPPAEPTPQAEPATESAPPLEPPIADPVGWVPPEQPEVFAPAPDPVAPVSAHDDPGAHGTTTEDHQPLAADGPAVVVRGRSEAPAGVRRVAASAMASAAGAEGPPRFGAPPRGTPRSRRGLRRVVPALVLLVAIAALVFAYELYQPGKDGKGSGRVAVRVPPGATAAEIGDLLAERDVVASSFFFGLRARLAGERANLRSGTFVLRRDMSYAATIDALTRVPPAPAKLAKLTIPEGPSRREVVPLVRRAGLKGGYLQASRRSALLQPASYGAPKGASLEGFLFPATYDLKPDATARSLVSQQVTAFKRSFATVPLARARRKQLSRFDVITIASMVEREAGVEKDRRLIAGVIYNRLKQGMPLGIDATIRYELGNFARPLRQSELQRDTPYNTRTRTGLPPGPIGNPGLASLKAAADPATDGSLFYVVKPCGNGAHAFSKTNEQFLKDVAAYDAKRRQLGGKDPSRC